MLMLPSRAEQEYGRYHAICSNWNLFYQSYAVRVISGKFGAWFS